MYASFGGFLPLVDGRPIHPVLHSLFRLGLPNVAPLPGMKKPGRLLPGGKGWGVLRAAWEGLLAENPLFAENPQFTGVTLATRPPWRWIICWVSSILSKVTNRTVLARLWRR